MKNILDSLHFTKVTKDDISEGVVQHRHVLKGNHSTCFESFVLVCQVELSNTCTCLGVSKCLSCFDALSSDVFDGLAGIVFHEIIFTFSFENLHQELQYKTRDSPDTICWIFIHLRSPIEQILTKSSHASSNKKKYKQKYCKLKAISQKCYQIVIPSLDFLRFFDFDCLNQNLRNA